MKINKMTKHAGLIIAALILGYFTLWERSPSFKFVELSQPKGFRTLVLGSTSSSAVSPLFGLPLGDVETASTTPKDDKKVSVCDALYKAPNSPVLGSKNAKVMIVEFFDYRCPYCKVLTKILFELQEENDIRIIYKEWPILSEGSKLAARAALSASMQDKYKEFHTQFMNARLLTTESYVKNMATEHQINSEKLIKDMNAPAISTELASNAALAKELGIIGTPALVVGRTIVQGAISKKQLKHLIVLETSQSQLKAC